MITRFPFTLVRLLVWWKTNPIDWSNYLWRWFRVYRIKEFNGAAERVMITYNENSWQCRKSLYCGYFSAEMSSLLSKIENRNFIPVELRELLYD
jgi:hypothetical protein